eukprot:CAMPEP_0183728100 /NCGR_PEP_ID=MMETSP0737-20130205/27148_1 /TAXON_ID=385413 /ORGANISM="Thalassiosira miniscula, Strain CCMP1093" /LENGTH=196 /DNA_ID=CAMNT_0025959937 /DNA_START=596 /DNA_END=1185 /DNA_ORIENTATION=-
MPLRTINLGRGTQSAASAAAAISSHQEGYSSTHTDEEAALLYSYPPPTKLKISIAQPPPAPTLPAGAATMDSPPSMPHHIPPTLPTKRTESAKLIDGTANATMAFAAIGDASEFTVIGIPWEFNPVDNGPEDSDRSSSPSICSIDGSNYEREREQEGNDEDSDLEEDELESHVKAGKREAVMAAACGIAIRRFGRW